MVSCSFILEIVHSFCCKALVFTSGSVSLAETIAAFATKDSSRRGSVEMVDLVVQFLFLMLLILLSIGHRSFLVL